MNTQFINIEEWGIDEALFSPYIKRSKPHLPKTEGVLNVVFVDDKEIHRLNKEYRKKDKPTDVLSFSYIETPDFDHTGLIGEIYISVETAKRQAAEVGWTLEEELVKLFVHGLLHIFGYDHETDEEYEEMAALEKRILGLSFLT